MGASAVVLIGQSQVEVAERAFHREAEGCATTRRDHADASFELIRRRVGAGRDRCPHIDRWTEPRILKRDHQPTARHLWDGRMSLSADPDPRRGIVGWDDEREGKL